jgi:ureidoglycolate hydrolase
MRVIACFRQQSAPIGTVCSLSQAVSFGEGVRPCAVLHYHDISQVEWAYNKARMMWELRHADKQSRPAKSSSSRHRPYTKRHPFFVL